MGDVVEFPIKTKRVYMSVLRCPCGAQLFRLGMYEGKYELICSGCHHVVEGPFKIEGV